MSAFLFFKNGVASKGEELATRICVCLCVLKCVYVHTYLKNAGLHTHALTHKPAHTDTHLQNLRAENGRKV